MAEVKTKDEDREYVRTNVVLDEALVREAMELTGIKTKRAVVGEALEMLVHVKRQTRIFDLFGKVEWEGDLDEMRRGRFDDGDC